MLANGLTAASMIGIQGYTILFNNFAVEMVHLEGRHIGIIQSIREAPGFLALLAVYVMLGISFYFLPEVVNAGSAAAAHAGAGR